MRSWPWGCSAGPSAAAPGSERLSHSTDGPPPGLCPAPARSPGEGASLRLALVSGGLEGKQDHPRGPREKPSRSFGPTASFTDEETEAQKADVRPRRVWALLIPSPSEPAPPCLGWMGG